MVELPNFFSATLCEWLRQQAESKVKSLDQTVSAANAMFGISEPDTHYSREPWLVDLVRSSISCLELSSSWDMHKAEWDDTVMWTRYHTGIALDKHCDNVTSLIVYLNDVFTGGCTVFFSCSSAAVRVIPVKGKAVLLRGDVEHYAETVTTGSKYIMRFSRLR